MTNSQIVTKFSEFQVKLAEFQEFVDDLEFDDEDFYSLLGDTDSLNDDILVMIARLNKIK